MGKKREFSSSSAFYSTLFNILVIKVICQAPADSKALQIAAERPVGLLILTGHQNALDEGQQLRGQEGIRSLHVTQNTDTMMSISLRNEQH